MHRFLGDSVANGLLLRKLLDAGYPRLFDGRESVVFAIPRNASGVAPF